MPSGLEAKVECVEPGGNRVGLISSSRAHRPDSAFQAVGQRLGDQHVSLTPKFSTDHSVPVRQKPIWISSTTSSTP